MTIKSLRCIAVALALPVASLGPVILANLAAAQSAPAAPPAGQTVAASEERLTQAQLEQLLAPIALYPDDLLMQVLMAATYPLEIVQAKRWLAEGQNASLTGDALVQALNEQPWDPSVKSVVPFADVLALMNDQLDWTQQVGDAVLAQQDDVLNAVQVLRGRAQASGSLQSGPQQTVNVTQTVNAAPAQGAAVAPPPQTIVIEPTNPDQVFVPAYNPSVVYGSWPYAEYPPAYYPPPVGWGVGNAILTGMAFAGSVAVVNSLWGWARPGWGRGDIDVNVNRFNNINVNRSQISGNRWQHDVSHRHGVAYRNDAVRDRVGGHRTGGGRDRVQAREQFRGRAQQADRGQGIGGRRPDADRPTLGDRRPGGGDRPAIGGQQAGGRGDRPGLADRGHGGAATHRPGGQRPAAQRPAVAHRQSGRPQARPAPTRQAPQGLRGAGEGRHERAAASRGRASRQGQPAARAHAQQRRAAQPHRGGGAAAHRGRGGGGHAGRGGGRHR
ncbi:DUF3300 domain-containing protein [Roseomonas terrae]|uniref:DUF3300 domain-containing protein n=1 Tax=Neoroseomonas terrae TaxID=424799 RepID=A0ABS5ECK8_9PROT|nr:DUF3300 domain-containing protein [Neoroseomonas terrae]MBR0648751.1 DUF3300 domain-containing protein [Neoroseomonas terrae]